MLMYVYMVGKCCALPNNSSSENSLAEQIKQEIDTGKFVEATASWANLEDVISSSSNSVVNISKCRQCGLKFLQNIGPSEV